jgi:hypothetical protein
VRRRVAAVVRARGLAPWVALLAVVLPARPAAAQTLGSPSRIWVGAGLGFGDGANMSASGAALAEIAYQKGPHQLTLRLAGLVDPFGSGANAVGDLGVLYGRVRSGSFGHASVSIGISQVGFDHCESSQDSCFTLGVPLVGEVALRVLPVLGLGVQAFGNLNAEASYGGAVVFVQLGSLR